jgi:hypothetical protein
MRDSLLTTNRDRDSRGPIVSHEARRDFHAGSLGGLPFGLGRSAPPALLPAQERARASALQRTYGNRVTGRLLRAQAEETKAPSGSAAVQRSVIQRECSCAGGDGAGCCAGKHDDGDRATSPHVAPAIVQQALRSPGTPLDGQTRTLMESRFGRDFGQVRLHLDDQASASAHAVHALAYTVGQDVVFGAGQYAPSTDVGKRVLAHELAHTIQQGPGVQALSDPLLVSMPDDPAEREAEAAARDVVEGRSVSSLTTSGGQLSRQPDGGAPAAPPPAAPAAATRPSGSISGGVSGITMNVTGDYTPCAACGDGLEAIQVFWGTRRTDGVQVGVHQTVFPPLAATFDSFVDGGLNSPGGATYSGNHPYYIGRPSLPASYGYNTAMGSAGSVTGCVDNPQDVPGAARLHDQAYFETAFVCLNFNGSGSDKLLDSFQWGFTGRGTTFKPSPYSSQTAIVNLSAPSAKFQETLRADYSGYSFTT